MRLPNAKNKNFIDKTGPNASTLKDKLGGWLLKNGYVNDASGKPYNPAGFNPVKKSAPGDWPTLGADIPVLKKKKRP